MEPTVLINGRAYGYADAKLQWYGVLITGWTAISYKKMQKKENIYTSSKFPSSRSYGEETYEASITLEMKEVERLTSAAGIGKGLLDLPPATLIISYINESNTPVTHKLLFAEILENGREVKTGDTQILVELKLIVAGIDGL